MSALGQKRTWRLQFAMSALHSIADIHCGKSECLLWGQKRTLALRKNSGPFRHRTTAKSVADPPSGA